MVSDMGGFVLPQLALSAAIAGDSGTKVLNPSGRDAPTATLIVPEKQCRSAVRHLLGEAGPHQPQCSPGGETTATDEAAAIP